jgi:Na+/melibiose symporter-like transporter
VLLLAVYITDFYERMGTKLAYISFYIALARSLDVISDPAMSYLTDSFRSSYGRRRPFCFIGCWLYAVMLVCLLSPPDVGTDAMATWFGAFYILYFLSCTLSTIPYDALGPEMTDSYEDRAHLFFVYGLYDGAGSLVAIVLPQMLMVAVDWVGDVTYNHDLCYHTSGVAQGCPRRGSSSEGTPFAGYDLGFGSSNYTSIHAPLFNSTACKAVKQLPGAGSGGVPWREQGSDLGAYCECVSDCNTYRDLANEGKTYTAVGMFFAIYFCVTITNMCVQIRERSQLATNGLSKRGKHKLQPAAPLVPSLLNTLDNRAFATLLPAWALDFSGLYLISSMLVYYVRYVLVPEYSPTTDLGLVMTIDREAECELRKLRAAPLFGETEGRELGIYCSGCWYCDSSMVLGFLVVILLVFAFLGCPLWWALLRRYGKRNTWLMWSCTAAVTNLLFAFVREGQVQYRVQYSSMSTEYRVQCSSRSTEYSTVVGVQSTVQ